MRQNPEFLAVVAFGAALLFGLSGSPIWMPAAVGVIYGIDAGLAAGCGTTAGIHGKHAAARQQAGLIASRTGAILVAYAVALGLRLLGST